MSVRQLLTSMDSKEISEWMAYFRIEEEILKKGDEPDINTKLLNAFPFGGKK